MNLLYDNRTIKIVFACILLALGLVLLRFVINVQWDIRHIGEVNPRLFPLMGKSALAGLLWGLRLEYKNLYKVFINGPALNLLIIPTIVLLVLTLWPWAAGFFYNPSVDPYGNIISVTGINPHVYPDAHMMISITTGVLLVRSLLKTRVNHDL